MANQQYIELDLAQFPVETLEAALEVAKKRKKIAEFKEKTLKVGAEIGRLEIILGQKLTLDTNVALSEYAPSFRLETFTEALSLYAQLVADPSHKSIAVTQTDGLFNGYMNTIERFGGNFHGFILGGAASQVDAYFKHATEHARTYPNTYGAKQLQLFMDGQRHLNSIGRDEVVSAHTRELFYALVLRSIREDVSRAAAVVQRETFEIPALAFCFCQRCARKTQ